MNNFQKALQILSEGGYDKQCASKEEAEKYLKKEGFELMGWEDDYEAWDGPKGENARLYDDGYIQIDW